MQRISCLFVKKTILNCFSPYLYLFVRFEKRKIADCLVPIWRFRKMGVPSNHPKLDHFSVENHGFADPTISETPVCICLSGFFMPVPRGSTIAATTVPSCYSPGEEVKLRCSNHLEVNRVEVPPFIRTGSCWLLGRVWCLQYVLPDNYKLYMLICNMLTF